MNESKPEWQKTPSPRSVPTRYRLVVRKQLSPTWSDRLGGMEIRPGKALTSQVPVTELEGIIQDQAQLSGILNTLYDLGFPILKVEALQEASE